ncbi:hypothetical protein [Neisseria iguanae]
MILEAGDILYILRSWLHNPLLLDCETFHLPSTRFRPQTTTIWNG